MTVIRSRMKVAQNVRLSFSKIIHQRGTFKIYRAWGHDDFRTGKTCT